MRRMRPGLEERTSWNSQKVLPSRSRPGIVRMELARKTGRCRPTDEKAFAPREPKGFPVQPGAAEGSWGGGHFGGSKSDHGIRVAASQSLDVREKAICAVWRRDVAELRQPSGSVESPAVRRLNLQCVNSRSSAVVASYSAHYCYDIESGTWTRCRFPCCLTCRLVTVVTQARIVAIPSTKAP